VNNKYDVNSSPSANVKTIARHFFTHYGPGINCPVELNGKSMMVGPAKMVSSVTVWLLLFTTAYTVPLSGGKVAFPPVIGAKRVSRPVRNARDISPEGADEAVNETVTLEPGAGLGGLIDRGGKSLGKGGLVEGQLTMKVAAMVNIWLKSRGVCSGGQVSDHVGMKRCRPTSNGPLHGFSFPTAAAMKAA
jgi:hypothetical protein